MDYTKALKKIRKDTNKKFYAYDEDLEETLILKVTGDYYIEMTYGEGGSPVSFLNFRIMDLDWKEEAK